MKNDQCHEKLQIGSFPSCIYDDTSDKDINRFFWSVDDCAVSACELFISATEYFF